MREKPFEQIQVKEITSRADLSRPTFYMHYRSKMDILGDYFDGIFLGFFDELKEQASQGTVKKALIPQVAFEHWQNQQEIVALLKKSGLEFLLLRRVQEHIVWLVDYLVEINMLRAPKEGFSAYIYDFIAGGVFLILIRWLEEGCVHSPEVMSQMVAEFLGGLVKGDLDVDAGLFFKMDDKDE